MKITQDDIDTVNELTSLIKDLVTPDELRSVAIRRVVQRASVLAYSMEANLSLTNLAEQANAIQEKHGIKVTLIFE